MSNSFRRSGDPDRRLRPALPGILTLFLLFGYVDAVETVNAERVHLEARDLLAHRNEDERMVDGCPGSFLLEDQLRLLIGLGTLADIGRQLGLGHQVVIFLVAPLSTVV